MANETNPTGLTLHSLCQAFLLSRQHLSPRTLEYYRIILSNFEWYAKHKGWPEPAHLITREYIHQFLSYIATERNRWGNSDPSSSSARQASPRK